MSLQSDLQTFQSSWRERVGDEVANLVGAANDRLATNGLLTRIRKAGDRFPDVVLPDHTGRPVRIADRLAAGPLVISFYRGGWCPYCNLELRAYDGALELLRLAGGDLIAVSPERPDNVSVTIGKNDLRFPVLSDTDGRLADALGIRFDMEDEIVALYRKFGHDLPTHNGDGRWSLPVPATYVVNRDGVIALAHIDPDYRNRLEPQEAIALLRRLNQVAA
jgi:peroxiredoxin